MKKAQILLLKELKEKKTLRELSQAMDKSSAYLSKLLPQLEKENFVKKTRKGLKVFLEWSKNQKTILLRNILINYKAEEILTDSKEKILLKLLIPKTLKELEKTTPFSFKKIYADLNDLKSMGLILRKKEKYHLNPQHPQIFNYFHLLNEEKKHAGIETIAEVFWKKNNQVLKKSPYQLKEGTLTAFSRFSEFKVEIFPKEFYYYQPEKELSKEEILIHSLVFAKTKQEVALALIFYLKNKRELNLIKLEEYSKIYEVTNLWLDLLAYLDQREVKQKEKFLPWEEFKEKAALYRIKIKEKFKEPLIKKVLEDLSQKLPQKISIFLIGGANMMFRGLKTATKDIDIIVEDKKIFAALLSTFKKLGFQRVWKIEPAYELMEPSIILERAGFRVDIFTKVVCRALQLSPEMKRAAEERKTNNLSLNLLSLENIFLFKSITDREGDLEDCKILAEQKLNWLKLFAELKTQEKLTKKYFCFDVLDTLEILKERHQIETPILKKLSAHCLEIGILLTLKKKPKTVKEIKQDLDFSDYEIRNILNRLEKKKKVKVKRKGKLNLYTLLK